MCRIPSDCKSTGSDGVTGDDLDVPGNCYGGGIEDDGGGGDDEDDIEIMVVSITKAIATKHTRVTQHATT